MKKSVLILMVLVTGLSFSQDNSNNNTSDVRPYRIGLKIGVPNLASLEFEYVTPLLNNRVAPFVNYTGANQTIDEVKAGLNIFEIGSNIYFSRNTEGRGLYGSLSYQHISAKLEQQNYEAAGGRMYEGTATSKVTYGGLNVKFGAKLGRKFFFRTELGYSFGKLPTEIVTTGTYQGQSVSDVQNIEEDINDIPVISLNGLPIFNLGIGYAF